MHPGPRRRRKLVITAVSVVAGLLVVLLAAWGVDSSLSSGKTAHHLMLVGRDVGGLPEPELRAVTASVADEYQHAAVTISTPKGTLETTGALVGLQLDQPAVVTRALAIGRDGSVVRRPASWLRSVFFRRPVPLTFSVDAAVTSTGIVSIETANHIAPTEPSLVTSDTGITVAPGVAGEALDPTDIAERLKAAAETGVTPIAIEAKPVPVPPRFTDREAQALADRANAITAQPLVLSIAGRSATIDSRTLRTWMASVPGPAALELRVDQARVEADLARLVGDVGTPPVQLTFAVVRDPGADQDRVEIIDGIPGAKCCAPDSMQRIVTALEAGQTSVELALLPVLPDHDRAWAEGLGIIEPIGTFTTRHPPPAGVDRVANIHRIADIVRGMLIEPDQSFSVNSRVGERTTEKGFVEAPVIYDGKHTTDVGGGVSQFATTLFNAAFFAGLDLVDYQSHSEWIDRYPYGREATISWPEPDLKIHNNTPYGVLVWTTYTDTSLTITLYSTRWVTGEQTGQTTTPKERCNKVVTERTRTWLGDGHTEIDTVVANYVRETDQGIKC